MSKKLSLVIVFLLTATFGIYGEDTVGTKEPVMWIGPYAGLNYNYHFVNFGKLPPFPSCCPKYESGTGWGFSVGALLELKLMEGLYLSNRLGMSDIGARMNAKEQIGGTFLLTGQNYPQIKDTMATVEHRVNSKLMMFNYEPTLSLRFFNDFGLNLGMKFGYLFMSRFDQEEVLMEPDNVTFMSGSRIRNSLTNELIPEVNVFQMFGVIGASYNLPVSKDMYLTPEFRYYVPIFDISDAPVSVSDYWKASTFQFGLALKIPIYPAPPPPPPPGTIYREEYKYDTTVIVQRNVQERVEYDRTESSVTKEYNKSENVFYETKTFTEYYKKYVLKVIGLEAKVRTYGVNPDGSRTDRPNIIIEELEVEEGFPLLTHVFFDQGQSLLNESVMKLLKPEEADRFDENNLDWNAIDIYSNLLNIIGSRMRKYPEATITITGCNNNLTNDELNNQTLSISRANIVRDYLISTWKIDPPRIKIRRRNLPESPSNPNSPDGIVENQRAEISSDKFEVIQPVYLNEIFKSSNPPKIVIEPEAKAEAGLMKYEVTVNQGAKNLRRYAGEDLPDSLIWFVEPNPVPSTEEDVVVQFTAYDNESQKATAENTFRIEQKTIKKKRVEKLGDKIIQRYSLVLFDFDKAELTGNQLAILKSIKNEIKSNSKVKISGYTDRTGDAEYNRELARRRAAETQKALFVQGAEFSIIPVGSEILLYDNNNPHGRSYCRTVKIEIETPVTE